MFVCSSVFPVIITLNMAPNILTRLFIWSLQTFDCKLPFFQINREIPQELNGKDVSYPALGAKQRRLSHPSWATLEEASKIYVQALLPTINVWTTQLISLPFVDRKTQVPHTRLSSSDVEMPSSQGLFEFLSSNDAYFWFFHP